MTAREGMETQMADKVVADNVTQRPDLAKGFNEAHNAWLTNVNNLDPNLIRNPDYFVYIFSVADRAFNVSRPTLNISRVTFSFNPECLHNPEAYQFVMHVP